MAKMWDNFLFGLAFGVGLICAYGMLKLILFIIEMLASGVQHGGPRLP